MKKTTLLLILCLLLSFYSFSQLPFVEDFGTGSNWQGTWQQIDQDGSGGLIWFTNAGKLSSFSYDGVTQFNPDHYAITPAIDITNASGLYLEFQAGGKYVGFSEESFTVYVSTGNTPADFLTPGSTGATTVSSGLILLADHFPEANGGLANFNLDVSSLDGETTVYIAFRHQYAKDNQSMMQFDNVNFSAASLGTKDGHIYNFRYYINSNHTLILNSPTANLEAIKIYNVLGQKILSKPLSSTHEAVDLSLLSKGIYIINVMIKGAKKSFKIVRR